MSNTHETGFQLKSFEDIFASTDPNAKQKGEEIYQIRLDKLQHFKEHPFKLYEGQRLSDMVQSIKANGILMPIIVRPIDDFNYEILSGHNRVESAKIAGLEKVPSIIKERLSDEDAMLIVTETNLIQRSFADLSHSEKAVTLSMHHNAMKQQGKRNDLIVEIENLLNSPNLFDTSTCAPKANKLKSIGIVGERYDLSKDSVARYLRINKLITDFKQYIDDEEISIRAGVSLSYLSEDEQKTVMEIFEDGNYKIDMKKAEALRQLSEKKNLNPRTIEDVFTGKRVAKPNKQAAFKLKQTKLSKYFTPEQKQEEVEETILKALEYYFNRHESGIGDDAVYDTKVSNQERENTGTENHCG